MVTLTSVLVFEFRCSKIGDYVSRHFVQCSDNRWKWPLQARGWSRVPLVSLALQAEDLCTNMFSMACQNPLWCDDNYKKALGIPWWSLYWLIFICLWWWYWKMMSEVEMNFFPVLSFGFHQAADKAWARLTSPLGLLSSYIYTPPPKFAEFLCCGCLELLPPQQWVCCIV